MSKLLDQVRTYTKNQYRGVDSSADISGEYFGTYSGADQGTFTVHLDGLGNVYGSAQSDRLNAISFIITGSTTSDGLTEMTSSGVIDGAKFKGKLDKRTRKIFGQWYWGAATGFFSGQHE